MAEFWETPTYKRMLDNEWLSMGMIDPLQYSCREDWVKALTHERLIKDFIYALRQADADANTVYDDYYQIYRYRSGYRPLDWEEAQFLAFEKFGPPDDCRYIYDIWNTENRNDYYFDYIAANKWCRWIELCMQHVEGPFTGRKVLMTQEQRSFVRAIYGIKHKETHFRRYCEIFRYVPRKNSKTFDCVFCALGTLLLENIGGCKIVSVATCLEQAHFLFDPARLQVINDQNMRTCHHKLHKHFKVGKKSMTAKCEADWFKPIAFADASAHGGNFAVSFLDEIHAMDDMGKHGQDMYDVCVTSTSARDEPLVFLITTAATNGDNFCNHKFKEALDICRLNDPHMDWLLPVLYFGDEHQFGDDPFDIEVHKRVNPMYGLVKNERYFKRIFYQAKKNKIAENKIKRLDLNIVTASEVSAFNVVAFSKCKYNFHNPDDYVTIMKQEVPKFLLNKIAFVGIDLSGKRDLCSLTIDIPNGGTGKRQKNWVLSWSFSSKFNVDIRDIDRFEHRFTYCGEDVIDREELRENFLFILSHFTKIKEIGYDPYQAFEMMQIVKKETRYKLKEIGQNPKFLSEVTRTAIEDIDSGNVINHNGCIFFTWQIGNCQVKENNRTEYLQLTKSSGASPNKIDGPASWMNARSCRLLMGTKTTLSERMDRGESIFG